MEEKNLLEQLINNNPKAFEELVKKFQTMVINTCYGFVHNYEDAQDIAQEVFIEVHKSLHTFRKESKFSTWLYRISVNKSLNYIRDNKKNNWFQSLDLLFDNGKLQNENLKLAENPQEIIENKEKAEVVNNAIDSLAKNQKIAFTLYKYEGLSYKEIADVMQTSLSSVESIIFRAKKNLQSKLIAFYKKS